MLETRPAHSKKNCQDSFDPVLVMMLDMHTEDPFCLDKPSVEHIVKPSMPQLISEQIIELFLLNEPFA